MNIPPDIWRRVPWWIKLHIAAQLVWAVYIPRLRKLPDPVHYSLLACLISFMILTGAPHHVMSLPIAVGGGLSISLVLGRKYDKAISKSI